MSKYKTPILFIVMGLVFTAIIWMMLIQGPQQAMERADVTVEGTVVSSDVSPMSDGYYPDIKYRYTYQNETYTNDNFRPGTAKKSLSSFETEDIVERYPEGKNITVYLNPDNPSQSFLEKKSPGLLAYGMLGFSLLFVFIGVGDIVRKLGN